MLMTNYTVGELNKLITESNLAENNVGRQRCRYRRILSSCRVVSSVYLCKVEDELGVGFCLIEIAVCIRVESEQDFNIN